MSPKYHGISKHQRAVVYAKTDRRCFYCGGEASTVDHVIAFRSRQPRHGVSRNNTQNLLPACLRCNQKKGNKSMDLFRQIRGPFWGERILPAPEDTRKQWLRQQFDRFSMIWQIKDGNNSNGSLLT